MEEDLINLHHHRTPFESLPTLLDSYTLEAQTDAGWQTVATVTDNHHRTNRHHLSLTTTALRLRAQTTNGSPRAHVVSFRTYTS